MLDFNGSIGIIFPLYLKREWNHGEWKKTERH